MPWYSVRMIYQFVVSGAPHPDLLDDNYVIEYSAFEESIIILRATSFDEAYTLAEKTGKQNQRKYVNKYGQNVSVEYIDSIDCFIIAEDRLRAKVEIYSNILEANKHISPAQFISSIPLASEGKHHMLMHI